ncbi:MAG TPA: hypothetical protein VJ551_03070 [Nitrososphaeraceae archaeon]|nr:hypothetical protein [Nitrososphaeraceae archaeon]
MEAYDEQAYVSILVLHGFFLSTADETGIECADEVVGSNLVSPIFFDLVNFSIKLG